MPKKKTALTPRQKTAPSPYQNHAYINPDGTVDGERLLKIVRETPGAFSLIITTQALKKKPVSASAVEFDISQMIDGLTFIMMLAAEGDEKSANQLRAIEKLISPSKYDLPFAKIQEIIDRYETSPPLARGWELRRIMSNLTQVVEPLKKDRPYRPDHPITLREHPHAVFIGMADLARKHFKPNSTLQSLAIRIYLAHLQWQGVTDEREAITDRTLKRDLARVREWERTASDEEKIRRGKVWQVGGIAGSEPITWYEFSEGWKDRKKARKASSKKKLLKA